VRIQAFWIDTWLQSQYRGLTTAYVTHDAEAREVDEEVFFHTRESGGTRISSAYALAAKLILEDFPPSEWNIYLFHFSDGDNWGGGDTQICFKIMNEVLLPSLNLFCYGQVASPYGSGAFIKDLASQYEGVDNIVLSEIKYTTELPI